MGISLIDLFTRAEDIPVDLLTDDLSETVPTSVKEGGHSVDVEIAKFKC